MSGPAATGTCLAVVIAGLASACATSAEGSRPRSGTTTCRDGVEAFELTYPAAWYADGCRRFDPEPLGQTLLERDAAVSVEIAAGDPDGWVRDLEGPAVDVLARRRLQVAGRPAIRLRMRATRDSLVIPPGTQTTAYVVGLRGRVLVIRARARGGVAFDLAEDTLDRMAFSLKLP